MIQVKYILKENRETDFYDVGKIWFGSYKVIWNKWLLCNRILVLKLGEI